MHWLDQYQSHRQEIAVSSSDTAAGLHSSLAGRMRDYSMAVPAYSLVHTDDIICMFSLFQSLQNNKSLGLLKDT